MLRRSISLAAALMSILTLGSLLAAAPASAFSSTCGTGRQHPLHYRHVIVIMYENHSLDQVIGNRNAPYMNTMARNCGLATNYHSTAHLSYPDYSAVTAGLNYPSREGNNIFRQVNASGRRWAVYSQSMPHPCLHSDAYPYESGHNPATHYALANCSTSSLSLGSPTSGPLDHALRSRTLPAYTWLVPDKCHDMHDVCYGNAVLTADNWTKAWITRIVNSRTYQAGSTAILLTWDEGWKYNLNSLSGWDCYNHLTDNSCHVATIVISPYTPHGARSSTFFSHYSLLRTTEQMLGIGTYLNHARDLRSVSMRPAFHL